VDEWPTVSILLLTYEDGHRLTAERTLRSVLDRISYSGRLAMHIADDGSQDGHVPALRLLAGGYRQIATVGSTDASRGGYGRSYNLATQQIHLGSEVVLVLEDDWELTRDLNLDPLVATLYDPDPAVKVIRLGYLGFTQELRGRMVSTRAGLAIMLDPDSPEPHVAAGHPRLEAVAYQRAVGPWAEGLAPGATEWEWCRRPAAREGVIWPLDLGPASQRADSLFVHIGAHGLGELEPEL